LLGDNLLYFVSNGNVYTGAGISPSSGRLQ
jgi:hypothetical protein